MSIGRSKKISNGCQLLIARSLASGPRNESVEACRIAEQKIFANGIWYAAAISKRLKLPEGSKISGSALLIQPDATIYIDPSLYAVIDDI